MFRTANIMKIVFSSLVVALFSFSKFSYADWSVGLSIGGPGYYHDDHGFYRWHDHPHYGWHFHHFPGGYFTVWAGGVSTIIMMDCITPTLVMAIMCWSILLWGLW